MWCQACGVSTQSRPPRTPQRPPSPYRLSPSWTCGPCSGPSLAEALCLNKEGALCPFGFKQVIMKPKLRPTQHRLYSGAKEWRSGNKVHSSTSHPPGESGLILKVKTKGEGVRLMLGDRCVYGKGRAFRLSGVPPPFYLVLVLRVRSWPMVGVSLNIMIKLAASSDLK